MKKLLIILGLVIVPFYEILLRILPFVRSVAPDTREPKEIIALVFALSIGLLAVFNGEIKPFRNKYFLILPIYILISFLMAPHVPLFINKIDSGDLYFWKPFAEILCFSLMIIAIASMDMDVKEIIKVMVICGTIMSVYMILQLLDFDQFWLAKTGQSFTSVRSEAIGGNLGQPTIAASFIVMMIPLAIYLKKYWCAGVIGISVLLTGSAMAIGAIVVMGLVGVVRLNKIFFIPILIILIISGFLMIKHKDYVESRMDGRYQVWSDTLKDIHNGEINGDHNKYPITGVGLGRFSYLFPMKNNSEFMQTHNDPLEFTYDCGLLGFGLLMVALYFMFKNSYGISFPILLSFIALLFCSFGSFPFQLGAHQFYGAALVGILNNDSIIKGA